MCNQFAFLTSKQEKIPVLRPKRQPLEERDRFPGRFKGETGKTGSTIEKIALVTDSTADLTAEMQKELNIHVIPLKSASARTNFLTMNSPRRNFTTVWPPEGLFPKPPSLHRKIFSTFTVNF